MRPRARAAPSARSSSAHSSAFARCSPAGTTSLTRPAARACWASRIAPVKIMYLRACSVGCARPRTTPGPGEQPDGGLGGAEAGGLVGDDEVADHRQLAAAAEGMPVHGCDRRLRQLVDRAERRRAPPARRRGGHRRRRARRIPRCRRRPRTTCRLRGRRRPGRRRPACARAAVSRNSVKKSRDIAFSFSGRSSVSHATGPRTS